MSRKLKIIFAVVVGVVVLAIAGGAVAFAADAPPATTSTTAPANQLFTKVAATLGVTEQQLTDALKQASTQIQGQRVDQALAAAVTAKTITQDEANAIKAWLAQRPTTFTKDAMTAWQAKRPTLANQGAWKSILVGGAKMMMGAGVANQTDLMTKVAALLSTAANKTITVDQLKAAFTTAETQMKAAAIDTALSNAVTNGKLTQTESDQIKAWWNSRPAALDKLTPNVVPGIPGFRGGMMRGKGGAWGGMMRPGTVKPTQPTTTTTPTVKPTN